jgi:hypothetical protein
MNEKEWEWMRDLDDRMRSEVELAINYAHIYHHGTAGHLAYMTIAKLAEKLMQQEMTNAAQE